MTVIKSYYGGTYRDGAEKRFAKTYPATGEVIAEVELATKEMLDEAVAMAHEAQKP